MKNSEGPNDSMPNLREELWAELILEGRDYPRPEIGSKNVLMLEERVQELEDALDCKGQKIQIQTLNSSEYQIFLMCYSNYRVILNWCKPPTENKEFRDKSSLNRGD